MKDLGWDLDRYPSCANLETAGCPSRDGGSFHKRWVASKALTPYMPTIALEDVGLFEIDLDQISQPFSMYSICF